MTSSPVRHTPFPANDPSEMPQYSKPGGGFHSGKGGTHTMITTPTRGVQAVGNTFRQHEQRTGPIPHISMKPAK